MKNNTGKIVIIGFLLAAFLLSSVVSAILDIEVEEDSGVGRTMIFDSTRLAQSFEPSVDTITSVEFYLTRSIGTTGDYTVSICESSGGTPATVLWSDTTAISDIATIPSESWESFSCSVSVTPGQTYFLMTQVEEDQPCAMECDRVDWLLNSSNTYSDGVCYQSSDNGSNWNTYSYQDFCFRVYGDLPPNEDPTACFSYSTSNLQVNVNAGCSIDPDGSIVSYQWDWTSDGVYDDTGVTKSHTYPSSNTYTMTLRVVDNDGASDTTSESVTVSSSGGGNQPPAASFIVTSTSGLTVNVNAIGSSDPDGSITLYSWDWTNDGSYDDGSASVTASHTYTSADTYTINLRVTDNDSATDTYTRTVTVPSSSGSSGFTSDNTMYYLLAGVGAAVIIGLVIYFGPTRKNKHNPNRPGR